MNNLSLFLKFVFSLFLLLLCSCVSDGGKKDEDDDTKPPTDNNSNRPAIFNIEVKTDERGIASTNFLLPDGTTKFSITAENSSGELRFDALVNSIGTNYLNPNGEEISFASEFAPSVNTAIAPSRSSDPGIINNETHTAAIRFRSNSSSSVNKKILLTVHSQKDESLSSGSLSLNVFLVGDSTHNADTRQIVTRALERMSDIYNSEAKITINSNVREIEGDAVLPLPRNGSDFYRSAAVGQQSPAVNIFIAEDIESVEGQVLGVAGAIPGAPFATETSAVVISLIAGGGVDGLFSDEEIRVLGETLAHEAGHYIGLFHPIEISGSVITGTDPISDTPTCSSRRDCLSNPDIYQNLMFPTPVTDDTGLLLPQNRLTTGQAGVMNRHTTVK